MTTPQLVRDENQLISVARTLEQPVVMKLVSQDILHKTDAGGVKLNLTGEDLIHAYREILTSAEVYHPGARVEGVLLAPMVEPGTEVILGVTQDAQYGPVMMFGLGGIFVEVLQDVAFRALPIRREDALEMFEELKGRAVLNGVRGSAPINTDALIELMLAVSNLCVSHPEITELDLNPVRVAAQGYAVLDARIILSPKDVAA